MRYRGQLSVLLFAIVGVLALGCATPEETAPDRADRPNIIIVLLDDTGYADIGAYGSEISWCILYFIYSRTGGSR